MWNRLARGLCLVPVALSAGLAGPLACSDEAADTGGKRVELGTRVVSHGAQGFTSASGHSIVLSRALLATGPLYYFEGAPLLARLGSFFVGVAHAHPGHYQSGATQGEMLEEWSVDLLAPSSELPAGNGVTGRVRSATMSFAEKAAGPFCADLGGHVVLLEGSAEKAGVVLPFRAVADLDQVKNAAGQPLVEGCVFEETALGAGGAVELEVDLQLWLDQVDFSQVPAPAPGEVAELTPGSAPHKDFVRGLMKAASYHFRWKKE